MPTTDILKHLTDAALQAKVESGTDGCGRGPYRVAKMLLTIPVEYRERAANEATRQTNMVPGERYSDGIASAVYAIKSEVGC